MKKSWMVLNVAILLTLAACNQDATEEADSDDEAAVDEAESQTMTDGLGIDVEIPAHPERILASYLEDYLVALDVEPVAQWSVNDGESTQRYLEEEIGDLPLVPHDLPFESVLEIEPDLMIVRDPIEESMHEQYSEITPTYVLNSTPTEWRETLSEIGDVLNKEEEAENVLAAYEDQAAEYTSQVEEQASGESAAAIWSVGNSLFIVHEERSSGTVLYHDLGLEVPEIVSELSSDADWEAISLEELAQMDVDHLFFINSDGPDAEILEDRLWQNIPAVQNGQVYEFGPDTAWLYYGPIASEQILEDVTSSILD